MRTAATCDLNAPRDVRRAVHAQERAERASGRWSPFELVPREQMEASRLLANERFGGMKGWPSKVTRVYRNNWLAVLVREIKHSSLGTVEHAAIRTAMNAEPTWKEMQRIKDAIFGADRMAIQVYPRTADLVDAADMYHLWVFAPGFHFDFGLSTSTGEQ